jgi:hypothetical protein
VSSDQRLRSGFCWPAIVEPGDDDIDEREVVLNVFVVADELEDKIRSGMRRESRVLLPLPLLMLVLGKREVLLKEGLGLRGWYDGDGIVVVGVTCAELDIMSARRRVGVGVLANFAPERSLGRQLDSRWLPDMVSVD